MNRYKADLDDIYSKLQTIERLLQKPQKKKWNLKIYSGQKIVNKYKIKMIKIYITSILYIKNFIQHKILKYEILNSNVIVDPEIFLDRTASNNPSEIQQSHYKYFNNKEYLNNVPKKVQYLNTMAYKMMPNLKRGL